MTDEIALLRRGGDKPLYDVYKLVGDEWIHSTIPHLRRYHRNDLRGLHALVYDSQGKWDRRIAWDHVLAHADEDVARSFTDSEESKRQRRLHKKEVTHAYNYWYFRRGFPRQKGYYGGPEVYLLDDDNGVWSLCRDIPTGLCDWRTEKIELDFIPTVAVRWDDYKDLVISLLKKQ